MSIEIEPSVFDEGLGPVRHMTIREHGAFIVNYSSGGVGPEPQKGDFQRWVDKHSSLRAHTLIKTQPDDTQTQI